MNRQTLNVTPAELLNVNPVNPKPQTLSPKPETPTLNPNP